MRGAIRILLVAVALLFVVFVWRPWESNLVNCGSGVYVQSGQVCPGANYGTQQGETPNTNPAVGDTPVTQQQQPAPVATQPVVSTGVSLVTTSGQPCPTHDFSLQQGNATCDYPGGRLLICEGDLNDSLGVQHDSDATTGQVDEIDQAATIDGRDNGGSCHYSPPWSLQMSINSVKHGCGGGCASVLVYKDGQLVQTV